ncbi:hypothetical protein SynA1825c_01941 [Synechococcus sp. A18-25c]|nr:hypothetical protein SynA1825c_01941 [Synechococcus sp. A18-25c]
MIAVVAHLIIGIAPGSLVSQAVIQLRLVLSLQQLRAGLDGGNKRIPLNSSLGVKGLPCSSFISPLNNGF